ncbi:unnamed protein product, partial [Lampetra fluviatilis]
RLEDTVLNPELDDEAKSLRIGTITGTSVTGTSADITGNGNGNTSLIPARIREIVTRHLQQEVADAPASMASLLSVQEENRLLQKELSRMEDQLSQCHADRDTLAIKYNALSERMEGSLRVEAAMGEQALGEEEASLLLRRRVDEEASAYRRKLQAYQEGQQRQAQLVQKLQAKVLQYKKKCGDLEQQLLEKSVQAGRVSVSDSRLRVEAEQSSDLENALDQAGGGAAEVRCM